MTRKYDLPPFVGTANDEENLGPELTLRPDNLNRYAYVRSNPLRLIDSTGLESVPAVSSVPAQPDAPHAAAEGPSLTAGFKDFFVSTV